MLKESLMIYVYQSYVDTKLILNVTLTTTSIITIPGTIDTYLIKGTRIHQGPSTIAGICIISIFFANEKETIVTLNVKF